MRAKAEAIIKQQEADAMDRKAERADEHREQLRSDRQTILERIEWYHQHIDGSMLEMKNRIESRIDQTRAGVGSKQELLRLRKGEACSLRQQADWCRLLCSVRTQE